jgi:hypothetical protein
LSFLAISAAISGNGTLAAKLTHDRIERSLCLPGKLERERGLPAAWLAVEQRAARIFRKRAVKHFKRLGTAHEIVRRRRKEDRKFATLSEHKWLDSFACLCRKRAKLTRHDTGLPN